MGILREGLTKHLIDSVNEMEDLYFCGIRFPEYLINYALFRYQRWLGFGLCSEMSVLSMLLMRHNQSAKLCQGTHIKSDGSNSGFHCWVEFMVDEHEFIMDLTWSNLGLTWIAAKTDEYDPDTLYTRESENVIALKEGGKLVVDWSISYSQFWEYELSKQLYEEMQSPKTSYIFNDLVVYAAPEEQKGFLIDKDWRSDLNGRIMVPYYRCGKPMSAVIIKYFVNHPKDSGPSSQVLARTEDAIRTIKRYLKQQGIAEI